MIYLVRHGEAAASWGDALDPGLSELGHQQSAIAAARLSEMGAFPALKSPMARCQETATALEKATGKEARTEIAVSEIETPQGLADRAAWLGRVMRGKWSDADYDFTAWRNNALNAVTSLPDGAVAFTHFIAINAIVGLLNDDPRVIVFRPGHCSITSLSRNSDGSFSVARLGDEAATKVL